MNMTGWLQRMEHDLDGRPKLAAADFAPAEVQKL
jgi:hypothetical protein